MWSVNSRNGKEYQTVRGNEFKCAHFYTISKKKLIKEGLLKHQ